MLSETNATENDPQRHSAWEVLAVFLRLGCTSFGGPVAHMGYFRKEFVERRCWLSEGTYAELMALAHSLPGPGSSQVGFSIGLLRAGWWGGLAAFTGFTLPSAVLMIALAYGHNLWSTPTGAHLFHGLQLVAVAVVAQAVVAMQRSLAPDLKRMLFAVASLAMVLLLPWATTTLLVIVIAGLAGLLLFRSQTLPESVGELALPRSMGRATGVAFGVLLVAAFAAQHAPNLLLAAFAAFYRSGALVFGGGHVVLPLLEHAIVDRGWVSQPAFLAGYGAAQAMPGPLFSFGGYLGAAMAPAAQRVLFGAVCLLGIFVPGLLAMAAVLPYWGTLRQNQQFRAALLGINASVVGILAAALAKPLWVSTLHTLLDVAIVVVAFGLLNVRRVQPWMVVLAVAAVSFLLR